MVMRCKYKILSLLMVVIFTASFTQSIEAFDPSNVSAVRYHIDQEWAIVWINEDASVDIQYNITITYESSALGYISIGLPREYFNIVSVKDLSGNNLKYKDISSGEDYAVEAYFGHPMEPGNNGTVLLIATIPYNPNDDFIGPDKFNSGYIGMQFKTSPFDAWTEDLRVAIVPPEGVTEANIKTSEPAFLTTIDGSFAVYWSQVDIPPNTPLIFGVSVPEEYIALSSTGLGVWFYLAIFSIIVVAVVAVIYLRRRREVYAKPRVMIEALGSRRGLTSVEAAVVVDIPPVRVLTMILFSLLLKRLVVVEAVEPLLKVKKLEDMTGNGDAPKKRYYEIDFLKAVEPAGSLNERRLARTYLSLRDNVDRKMRGYSRADAVNYYKSVITKAWDQVTHAGTPQLQEEAIENNIQWLLVDEDYEDRFKTAFPSDMMILPRLGWHWYWYGPYFSRGPIGPGQATPTPIAATTPTPDVVKPMPVQEFAGNIVSGLERATNNIVRDVEQFADRLLQPQRSSQSSESIRRRSNCVCACAQCACACACVSCACACAGGGAR
jgi:hypothetical protein